MRDLTQEQQFNLALEASFNRAIVNRGNIKPDGDINWDYVDADVYMDMCKEFPEFKESGCLQDIYRAEFDAMIDDFYGIDKAIAFIYSLS